MNMPNYAGKNGWILITSVFLLLALTSRTEAGSKIILTKFSQMTDINDRDSKMNSLARELGLTAAAIPLAPAEPLGLVPGLDIGLGISVADIHDENAYWDDAVADGKPMPVLILPQIIVRKGIPWGIDLGATYTPTVIGSNLSLLGAEAKWSFVKGSMLTPALALRVDYHHAFGASDFSLQTLSTDISISKGFGPLKPYTGIGMDFIFFNPDAFTHLKKTDPRELKGYAGVRIKLLLIQIVPEIDLARNFLIYSLKVGLIL
ncbi:MAG: hypothetical protein NT056_00245 [Proteobacteria bacterium]|nr:hypothetical protein [Pseudomonadota bacterium]